ncbi:MAG: uridine kinase [Pseudomonadota bacterium]
MRHFGAMAGVHIIGIAGGSCSGKTRLLHQLLAALGPERCALVLQDNYYHSRPEAQRDNLKFNFDHPDSIDFEYLADDLEALKRGQEVVCPQYDFARHERIEGEGVVVAPRPIVLLDGILILTEKRVRQLIDFSAYIACAPEERLRRRLARDVAERGRIEDNVIAQFEQQVQPMHLEFVRPSSTHATLRVEQSMIDDGSALCTMVEHAGRLLGVPDVSRHPGVLVQ